MDKVITSNHENNTTGVVGDRHWELEQEHIDTISPYEKKQEDLGEETKALDLQGSTGNLIFSTIEGKDVIVKEMVVNATDKEIVNRIKTREIYQMCKLGKHKSINEFIGWIQRPDSMKLILEKCNGGDLTQYYENNNLTLKQKVKIMLDVAEGLEKIHEFGIIHRDIKAANIALDKEITGDETDFTAKILDFGLARGADMTGGATTHVAGTARYSAPEQGGGQPYTDKVDMWAFSFMCYELLCGHQAFSASKYDKINDTKLKMFISSKALRPSKDDPVKDCPEDIMEICTVNWSKDPEDRMSSSEAVEKLTAIYGAM